MPRMPAGNHCFILEILRDDQKQPATVAPGDGHIMRILRPGDGLVDFGLLLRYLPEQQGHSL